MSAERPRPAIPTWSLPLLGALAVIAGLAPWLATGARLPLQNLWEEQTPPGEMPLVALPISQYELGSILAMFVVGGVLAGLIVRTSAGDDHDASRAASSRSRFGGAFATGLGAAIALAAVIVQPALVVAGGLRAGALAGGYLTLAVAWAVLCGLVALALLGLIGSAPRPGATIAWAVAAAPIGTWVGLWLRPSLVGYPDGPTSLVGIAMGSLRWLPAIVVGVALAWCGLRRRPSTLVAWLISLAVLWITPAALTGLTYIAGYRRPGDAWELLSSGLQVFGMALAPNFAGPPVLLALAVGVAGAVTALAVRRARSRRQHDDAGPPGAGTPRGTAGRPRENERMYR